MNNFINELKKILFQRKKISTNNNKKNKISDDITRLDNLLNTKNTNKENANVKINDLKYITLFKELYGF